MKTGFCAAKTGWACARCGRPSMLSSITASTFGSIASTVSTISTPMSRIACVFFWMLSALNGMSGLNAGTAATTCMSWIGAGDFGSVMILVQGTACASSPMIPTRIGVWPASSRRGRKLMPSRQQSQTGECKPDSESSRTRA